MIKKIYVFLVVGYFSFFGVLPAFAATCNFTCDEGLTPSDNCTSCRNMTDEEKKQSATPTTTPTSTDNLGINMSTGCLMGASGKCFDVSETLGLKKDSTGSDDSTSVLMFVQDIILAATFFIGTVVTIAFIYSGFKLISSSGDAGEKKKAITGMKNAAIGMILVASSYAIIRLIQYIAAG
jgi:DnaJ-class molecular chaperone